jgi:carbon-monoxide dehydrogenase iron sulfur subunit
MLLRPRTITVDSQRCTGCGDCTRACLQQLRERSSNERDGLTRIKVFGQNTLFWLAICRQCKEAPCRDACISGALQENRSAEQVELNEETCIGCGMCVMVCPFGSIWLDGLKAKSAKCDSCPTREIPPCVTACKPGALRLEPISIVTAEHRRRTTESVVTPDRRLNLTSPCSSTVKGIG